MLRACNLTFLFSLNSHSKQTGDECCLLYVVSFFYPAYLTFPEHVHRFISLHGSPRSLERKEAHPELDEPFHEAMILLDEVIEIFTLPQFASVWHQPRRFELFERFWIGRVFINGDDARRTSMRRGKRFREEAFGRLSIAPGAQEKFQGISLRIYSTIVKKTITLPKRAFMRKSGELGDDMRQEN